MKYPGSKRVIARKLLPHILPRLEPGRAYVEPFLGGGNMMCLIPPIYRRIGNDINKPLVEMWLALQSGWVPPDMVTRAEYEDIKSHRDDYPPSLVAFAGFYCSFPLLFFGQYRVEHKRNFAQEGKNVLTAQIQKMRDVEFTDGDYRDLQYPERSIIYCDPPYAGTHGYGMDFDHAAFWAWAAEMSEQGHDVYVSETRAPEEFETLIEIKHDRHTQCRRQKNITRIERLFKYRKSLQKSMT